jgi:glucose-1-phosphate adenylyltransferase
VIPEDVWIAPDSRVIHSVLSPGVRIESAAIVQNSILLNNVQVGARAQIHRAILDENVRIADDAEVGLHPSSDSEYGVVTDSGIVAIPAATCVARSQTFVSSRAKWRDFVAEDPFKTQWRT